MIYNILIYNIIYNINIDENSKYNSSDIAFCLGKLIELNKLTSYVKIIDWLYVCNYCGKCYWESGALESCIKHTMIGQGNV